MSDFNAIVIGAGCGGLTAGAFLARSGRKTLVLEQASQIGGCCSTFEREGYKFDIGASIVEALPVMEQVFERLGENLHEYLSLTPCDPIYDCIFRDGSRMSFSLDLDKTRASIEAISREDGEGFRRYVKKFSAFVDHGGEAMFTTPLASWGDFLKLVLSTPAMMKFLPEFATSYEDQINKYFKHEKIKQSMAFQAFYCGHSPDLAPGIFAMIPYAEHRGIYYPKGGMIRIPEALKQVGEKHGLEVRLNQRVDKLLVREGVARGVRLADGTEITADLLVSNINAKTLYSELIGLENLGRLARQGIQSFEPSISCPMVYLGLDYQPPLSAHHTLMPVDMEEMDDYYWNGYLKGRLPDEEFGLICCPTLSDPGLAPEGHGVIILTLMGPFELAGTDWDAEKEGFISRIIDYLDARYVPDLKKHVQVAAMTSPLDFSRKLLHPGGAIYGLQQDVFAQTVFRPFARSKSIKKLYLTGSSTHPGGGVPTTMASGLNAWRLIEKYE